MKNLLCTKFSLPRQKALTSGCVCSHPLVIGAPINGVNSRRDTSFKYCCDFTLKQPFNKVMINLFQDYAENTAYSAG